MKLTRLLTRILTQPLAAFMFRRWQTRILWIGVTTVARMTLKRRRHRYG